jgi:hypothetical protein
MKLKNVPFLLLIPPLLNIMPFNLVSQPELNTRFRPDLAVFLVSSKATSLCWEKKM